MTASNKWNREASVSSALLCAGLAVVYGTGIPNDIGVMLFCMWLGHWVTSFVWCRRLKREERRRDEVAPSPVSSALERP